MRGPTFVQEVSDDSGCIDMGVVADLLGTPLTRLASLTPMSSQALQQRPGAPEAQPAARRLVALIERIIENTGDKNYAIAWLRNPHEQLRGKSPLEVVEEGRFEVVEALIRAYETGQPL